QAVASANAPQWRRADTVARLLEILRRVFLPGLLGKATAIVLYDRNNNAVARAYVVQKEVAKRRKLLLSKRFGNAKSAAVDLGSRRSSGHDADVTIIAADLVEQL